MKTIQAWVLLIILFLCLLNLTSSAVEMEVRSSLIDFLGNLSNGDVNLAAGFGWKQDSDPCIDSWNGVVCNARNTSVTRLRLERLNLSGSLDAGSLCDVPPIAKSLAYLVLNGNNLEGELPAGISNCRELTHLEVGGNKFSGSLPNSLASLNNLKALNISYNNFFSILPNLSGISGLQTFLAQENQLNGPIPPFDFSNFYDFNVSHNNFSGPIPNVNGYFNASSFDDNPFLCGNPLPNNCPTPKKKGVSDEDLLMYSGYAALCLAFIGVMVFKLCNKKRKTEKFEPENKVVAIDDSANKVISPSSEYKTNVSVSKAEVSASSTESAVVSTSLVVLTSSTANGLRFEDLLEAPAELIGRGKYGSLYKVACENGRVYAVKRIKNWEISVEEFKRRMQRIDQVKHPNVLPIIAFYSSEQEKLLVYEYQQNGSLFRLLHGTQVGQSFKWRSRLNVAARIAEALATMHRELRDNGIAHGNLKSTNIMLNKDMGPCISEYGLMVTYDQQDSISSLVMGQNPTDQTHVASTMSSAFASDVYSFGVILLELLTGKMVHDKGIDLAKWVHSVVREEWTVEVFDKSLISEGASEERLVNLLQVAIKCVNRSPEAHPSMSQVASMINTVREEEDKSTAYESDMF